MKMKFLSSILFLLFLGCLVVFFGCEGKKGPSGPPGDPGDPGLPGADWTIPVPEDRIFSVAVFNGTVADHNGNATLLLTADTAAELNGSTVIIRKLAKPPMMDGINDGAGIWGADPVDIGLDVAGGNNNQITSAKICAGYDKDYVYFMVEWEEKAHTDPDFDIGVNQEHKTWKFDGNKWRRNFLIGEDRVALFWLLKADYEDKPYWDDNGCRSACHSEDLSTMYTRGDTTAFDAWVWGSVTSTPLEFATDGRIVHVPQPYGFVTDEGSTAWIDNMKILTHIVKGVVIVDTVPIYQHRDDPNSNPSYPLWFWDVQSFDSTAAWQTNATLPGVIVIYPDKSSADILTKGRFDNGKWTVEFMRVRDTNNPDDIVF